MAPAALTASAPCRAPRYLLPPIIFYAGLSVKKKQFFRNFATIASFGIFGTYIAFALIALVLYGLAQLPNVLNLSVRRASSCSLAHALPAKLWHACGSSWRSAGETGGAGCVRACLRTASVSSCVADACW